MCWHYIPELVGLLSPAAQWELHRFYAPSVSFADDEWLAHVRQAVALNPSLAQRAGKHYALIFSTFKHYADKVGKTNWEEIRTLVARDYSARNADPTLRRSVVIMPLVRPGVDAKRLEYALAELARKDQGDAA